MQSIRLGLNYRIGDDSHVSDFLAKGPSALETDRFAFHAQATYVNQYDPPFRAPYSGKNSLSPNIGRETFDVTLYAGVRLWQGAEAWITPEIDQGFGLSSSVGAAGFPSGEAYKVGAEYPYTRLHRAFLRQTIDLGGEVQKVDAGLSQFSGSQTSDRLVLTVGKFSVGDIFDTNKYAHDPRTDFMNWTIIDTGTFDYAADAWAYSVGAAAEWYQGPWTLRAGLFDLSIAPNATHLDSQFSTIPVGRRNRAAICHWQSARQTGDQRISDARPDGKFSGRHPTGSVDRRTRRYLRRAAIPEPGRRQHESGAATDAQCRLLCPRRNR